MKPFLKCKTKEGAIIINEHENIRKDDEVYKSKDSLGIQDRSPLILLANCMSLGIMVTRFAWMAHKFVSSKRPIMYASAASWRARTADD